MVSKVISNKKVLTSINLFRTGMCKITGTHEVEISWEPPKGDFTKYVLAGKLVDAPQSYLNVF